jgi:hypothetical protein
VTCRAYEVGGGYVGIGFQQPVVFFSQNKSVTPVVFFSQNKSVTNNQPTVFFSQNKSAPVISHQAKRTGCWEEVAARAHHALGLAIGWPRSTRHHVSHGVACVPVWLLSTRTLLRAFPRVQSR